jgi:hypothetical protein
MPVTKDIGGGVQILDAAGLERDAVGDLTKQLGLVDLVNKIQAAPVDLQVKKIESALKGNELLHIGVANAKAQADLVSAQNNEKRAQAKFEGDALQSVHQAFAQDYDLGVAVLQQTIPGAMAKKKPDGTVAIAFPTRQGFKTFGIDPQNIADPKERASIEGQQRQEWLKASDEFNQVNRQYNSMQELSKLGTGQADIGIVYAYNKILDPGSRVTQGEVMTAQSAPNLPTEIMNRYNRALKDGGPIFGDIGSRTRADFVGAARQIHDSTRDALVTRGQGFYELAKNQRLNPANVLIPVGKGDSAISAKTFEQLAAQQLGATTPPATGPGQPPAGTQPASQPLVPGADRRSGMKPQEAGILPSGAQQPGQNPTLTLDQMTQQALGNLGKRPAAPAKPAPGAPPAPAQKPGGRREPRYWWQGGN